MRCDWSFSSRLTSQCSRWLGWFNVRPYEAGVKGGARLVWCVWRHDLCQVSSPKSEMPTEVLYQLQVLYYFHVSVWKCPPCDSCVNRDDVRKVWKECQVESFWYRALPLSLGSMAVTAGLIYKGIWKSSNRFGPFPKLAVAGILGYAIGKASHVETCQRKLQDLGLDVGPGFEPWSVEHRCGPFDNSSPGHRFCNHVCEHCKKTVPGASAEQVNR